MYESEVGSGFLHERDIQTLMNLESLTSIDVWLFSDRLPHLLRLIDI